MNKLMKTGLMTITLSVLFVVLPMVSVLLAVLISSLTGCEVNEGYAEACPILWFDISELLYVMFVSGWFALITMPIGAVAVFVGVVLLLIGLFQRSFKGKGDSDLASS